jgi:exosortase H (IPTLxxWG-CTERM-specific)
LVWLASKGPVARFVLVFSLLIAVFYAAYLPFIETPWFKTYLAILAEACGGIVGLLGQEVAVNDRWVVAPAFSMEIVSGCDGLEATALFVSAVLASPVPLRSRLVFMAIGTGVLMMINLARIVSLFYIGVYFPKALDRIHFDAWPGLLIVLILGCWLIWARWAARTRGPHATTTV